VAPAFQRNTEAGSTLRFSPEAESTRTQATVINVRGVVIQNTIIITEDFIYLGYAIC
jgi:hypothetical protein